MGIAKGSKPLCWSAEAKPLLACLCLFTGVASVEGFVEVGVADVGVAIGGGDIYVTEHFLDDSEIGAVVEEVGGKRVAEGVWGDGFGDCGFGDVIFDHFPHGDSVDSFASAGDKEGGLLWGAHVVSCLKEVLVDGGEGLLAHGDESFFIPFSYDPDE